MVLLSFPAANRDPAMFPDADKVIIDRKENRHAAFGLGIHRCVGSNLARMEMTVAVEEFLKRIPEFQPRGPGDLVGRLRARPAQAAAQVRVALSSRDFAQRNIRDPGATFFVRGLGPGSPRSGSPARSGRDDRTAKSATRAPRQPPSPSDPCP